MRVLLHHSGNPSYKKVWVYLYREELSTGWLDTTMLGNKVTYDSPPTSRLSISRLIIPTLREFLTIPVKIALAEETPWIKIRMFLRGLLDGVIGRMGRLQDQPS